MATQAQQRFGFKRIIDGKTLSFVISPNFLNQIMSKDPTSFNPDFSKQNLVLKPILTVSGGGGENQVTKACKWWINGTEIVGTNTTWGATVGQTAPYSLTISKNLINVPSILIRADYEYIVPATGLSTNVSTQIGISRQENAGTTIIATMDYIDGNTFQTIGGVVQQLKLKARLIRGGEDDITNVTYKWSIRGTDGTYKQIIAATAPVGSGLPSGSLFSGFTTQTITVSSDAIINYGLLKCEITDTDSASTTKGKTAIAYAQLLDATDPIEIKADYPQGDSMSDNNEVGLKMRIDVYQKSKKWTTENFNGKTLVFYRETPDETKDTTFTPAAADFPGWTIGSGAKANEVSRAFASNSGTPENRTIVFLPKFMRNDSVTTMLMWAIDF